MKKNAIARMTAPKETVGSRFRNLHILPRFLCLLLALVLWLAVVHLKNETADGDTAETTASDTAQ
ncbi:MAG: hypothetical protein J6B71_08780 [Clostridia bacterium]|nr:hypothetical protein [Clostridia bacterium]